MTAPLIRLSLYPFSLNNIGPTLLRRVLIVMKRMGLLVILAFVLLFPLSEASALDTDLYAVTSTEVPPNVMIMFDNSISMNELVSGVLYDHNTTYPFVVTDYPDKVYYRTAGGSWNVYRDSVDGTSPDYTDGVNCLT